MKKIILVAILVLSSVFFYKNSKSNEYAETSETFPKWLEELIIKKKNDPVSNPPSVVYKCDYSNETTYFVPAGCCDIPSPLYDEIGDKICSPSGGQTGRGDEKCTDFHTTSDCTIIWEDPREYGNE